MGRIPVEEIEQTAQRLQDFLEAYHANFSTKTHDKSPYTFGCVHAKVVRNHRTLRLRKASAQGAADMFCVHTLWVCEWATADRNPTEHDEYRAKNRHGAPKYATFHEFFAVTRLDWMKRFQRDPSLLEQYETDVWPLFSVRNVRELLRAAMPLPQLSIQQAADLVIEHLTNRTRSRKSRLRKQREKSTET